MIWLERLVRLIVDQLLAGGNSSSSPMTSRGRQFPEDRKFVNSSSLYVSIFIDQVRYDDVSEYLWF